MQQIGQRSSQSLNEVDRLYMSPGCGMLSDDVELDYVFIQRQD